jgi:hypothetical protein
MGRGTSDVAGVHSADWKVLDLDSGLGSPGHQLTPGPVSDVMQVHNPCRGMAWCDNPPRIRDRPHVDLAVGNPAQTPAPRL